MTHNLNNFLYEHTQTKQAMQKGIKIHKQLQHAKGADAIISQNIINNIENTPEIKLCIEKATIKTEIPIAGYINKHFISRRIDRIYINPDKQIICFIDYKTNTDKTLLYDEYVKQLKEYSILLHNMFLSYTIKGFIFWVTDNQIEQVI